VVEPDGQTVDSGLPAYGGGGSDRDSMHDTGRACGGAPNLLSQMAAVDSLSRIEDRIAMMSEVRAADRLVAAEASLQ